MSDNRSILNKRSDADRFAKEFGWITYSPKEVLKCVQYLRNKVIVSVNFSTMQVDAIFDKEENETIYRKGLSIYNLRSVFENPKLRTWVSWTDSDTLEMQGKWSWVEADDKEEV